MAMDNKLTSDYIGEDIIDLVGDILRSETEFEEVQIKVNKMISTAHFNSLKEYILRFTKSYKVYNRKYKNDNTIIIYYEFILNSGEQIIISVIHEWGSYVMLIKDIRVKALNKGE